MSDPAENIEDCTQQLLHERYRVGDRIGSGSTGQVFKTLDAHLENAEIAIKVLHPGIYDPAEGSSLLRRDLALLQGIVHENLVRVFEICLDTEPFCIAMELVTGCSLADVINRNRGKLVWPIAREILSQILSALETAHRIGLVHSDLKPENVLITTEGIVKLVDFGQWLQLSLNSDPEQLCEQLGTPAYMSPEQFRGSAPTAQSDLYSFAVLAFELVTGELPFGEMQYFKLAEQHLTEPLPPLDRVKNLPQLVREKIEQCAKKSPKERPNSAQDIRAVFQSGGNGGSREALGKKVIESIKKGKSASHFRTLLRRGAILSGVMLICFCVFGVIVANNTEANARLGGRVLKLERSLGRELPLPKKMLSLKADWQNRNQAFDAVAARTENIPMSYRRKLNALISTWIRSGALDSYRYSGPVEEWRGRTLLHHLILNADDVKHAEIEILGQHGVDLNAKDRDGNTPLHCAAKTNRQVIAKHLLASGANVFIYNQAGWTPLQVAILTGDPNRVSSFLNGLPSKESRMALIEKKSLSGLTTLDLAKSLPTRSQELIIDLLKTYAS